MAIQLSESTNTGIIAEGEHILQITKVEDKSMFGKLEFTLRNAKGQFVNNNFRNLDTNPKAVNAMSYFVRCALDDFTVEEIEPKDLVGKYVKCEITHNKGSKVTFANITSTSTLSDEDKDAIGFDFVNEASDETATTETVEDEELNFDDFFGEDGEE